MIPVLTSPWTWTRSRILLRQMAPNTISRATLVCLASKDYDSDSDALVKSVSNLELLAVVTQSGNLDASHYLTYLRLNSQWYWGDDAWITHVDESMVKSSQAYMLSYVQKILYYKSSENAVSPSVFVNNKLQF